ncbi:S-adenosyl-L-methionine-dependent methyltransferase [Calycina marina]|uniref:Sterol 24-C-methyltransferase n=1 Tax=Calycina marina TaxID=1763456 RepID=A0A9P8CIU2_9HELO|nr:S-adenosyl-L-methionine-dependent methyltransferase [Calycina marina]
MSGKTREYDSGARFRRDWGEEVFAQVTDEDRMERNKNSASLNEAYYDFATDHYQSGWGDKFHFCGYQPGESWETAQSRHEHYLALMTEIRPGMKVLDVGCGVGGPAREIAIFTGAHVTGVSINDMHVERSNLYNKEANLEDQVEMVKGNFNALPFKDEAFHAAYATEALCCAEDAVEAYKGVFRVLKPGGRLGILDWVITPLYDDLNPNHRRIRSKIERGGAVPFLTTAEMHKKALEEAGFEMVLDEDRAIAKANPVPWWYALDGRHQPTLYDKYMSFMLGERAFKCVRAVFKAMSWFNLTHPSRMIALDEVSQCVFSCRDGGKEGIFSPMHLFVAQKPERKKSQ